MTSTAEQIPMTDTIRRMLRVLGAMPAHVAKPETTVRAARFIHDRLSRNSPEVSWYEPEGHAPLVVAGDGPLLLVTYMDDADPFASSHSGQPPSFRDSFISGPGILRKAGVVAAVAAHLHPDRDNRFTLVIETDRNAGSLTLERWLKNAPRDYRAGIWEATDLPMPAPAIIHSASGRITLRVTAHANHHFAESLFGGVIPDLGHTLSHTLTSLVSEDHEVRLPGFYDGIRTPDEVAVATLQEVAERTDAWLRRVAPGDVKLAPAHLTLGVYLAPAIVVRELRLIDPAPYLPVSAEAVVDFYLVPGQTARNIAQSAVAYFKERLPGATIEPLLIRPAVVGKANIAALRETYHRVLPTAPSINPAGMIESFGIPTVGFASVGRNPENTSGRVSLEDAVNGARLVHALARRMTGDADPLP
jgi:hypothetical protein